MRKLISRRLDFYCLARPQSWKARVLRISGCRQKPNTDSRGADTSEESLIFTARSKMQIQVVKEQVHWDSVIQRDLHDGIACRYHNSFAFGGDFQILHHLENILSNLLLAVAVHNPEARLFLHLVAELIVRNIGWDDFNPAIDNEHCNCQINERLELALPAFGPAVRRRAGVS